MAEGKVVEQENEIHIDVSLIPKHVQEELARATMEYMHRLLATPEGREKLEKKKKELGFI